MATPPSKDLLYSKTHEWCRVEAGPASGKTATVGLSAFALQALTDLVFLDLPPVGREVKAGQPFGEIESVKAVSDLYTPIGGIVTAVNSALNDAPETINKAANETWIIRLSAKGSPAEGLLSAAEYQKFVAEESGH